MNNISGLRFTYLLTLEKCQGKNKKGESHPSFSSSKKLISNFGREKCNFGKSLAASLGILVTWKKEKSSSYFKMTNLVHRLLAIFIDFQICFQIYSDIFFHISRSQTTRMTELGSHPQSSMCGALIWQKKQMATHTLRSCK